MNEVVIGLGSNIEPEQNIEKALRFLDEKYSIVKKSEFVQTKPVGMIDQADFINGSILINVDLSLEALDQELKDVEIQLGRDKTDQKFGPRKIDLDVIVFNHKIIDQDFYTRDFLRHSVLECIPDLIYEQEKVS